MRSTQYLDKCFLHNSLISDMEMIFSRCIHSGSEVFLSESEATKQIFSEGLMGGNKVSGIAEVVMRNRSKPPKRYENCQLCFLFCSCKIISEFHNSELTLMPYSTINFFLGIYWIFWIFFWFFSSSSVSYIISSRYYAHILVTHIMYFLT